MASTGNRNRGTALVLFGVAAGMVGLAYASVPLYRLFCQVTGYGGTTQVAERVGDEVSVAESGHVITVRFDANLARGMKWKFQPVQRQLKAKVGETALAVYRAVNPTDRRITGTSTFNVTPLKAGVYFNKIECFCFTEQTLEAGQSVDMPVSFYVDPEILKDPNTGDVTTITLSYTFFEVEEEDPATKTTSLPSVGAAAVN